MVLSFLRRSLVATDCLIASLAFVGNVCGFFRRASRHPTKEERSPDPEEDLPLSTRSWSAPEHWRLTMRIPHHTSGSYPDPDDPSPRRSGGQAKPRRRFPGRLRFPDPLRTLGRPQLRAQSDDLAQLAPNEHEQADPIPAFFRVELRRNWPELRKSGPSQYPRSALQIFRQLYKGLPSRGQVLPQGQARKRPLPSPHRSVLGDRGPGQVPKRGDPGDLAQRRG